MQRDTAGWRSSRGACLQLLRGAQVPLRTAFVLDTVPPDVPGVRIAAANATNFGFVDIHMNNKALSYLRSLDFDALWAGNDVVNVRWNGALWNHLILNAHLWPAAERYGLQTLSKRQARPAPGFQGP